MCIIVESLPMTLSPINLDVIKEKGLYIEWSDGTTCFLPNHHLRKMSPSADSKALREEQDRNPLTILPAGTGNTITINHAELVGNYAIRLIFSDGHSTGIYTWEYLHSLSSEDPPKKAND